MVIHLQSFASVCYSAPKPFTELSVLIQKSDYSSVLQFKFVSFAVCVSVCHGNVICETHHPLGTKLSVTHSNSALHCVTVF